MGSPVLMPSASLSNAASEKHGRSAFSYPSTEEEFLQDVYKFMRKRETPIDRIPHLGFKQIDLYLMFQTVQSFGGYDEVTIKQLWKQVYNKLGGNPRSTSAATCTRRHYERSVFRKTPTWSAGAT
ncbi:AT-rich interactive domain-containing protein 5A-like [Latimeria chalumnae]|uniref:AT-rich interactive domain-containing protein 5A-like n=1 Tax=Latimeria chalumnae TaxID=7897 RepID=UPI00313BBA74